MNFGQIPDPFIINWLPDKGIWPKFMQRLLLETSEPLLRASVSLWFNLVFLSGFLKLEGGGGWGQGQSRGQG